MESKRTFNVPNFTERAPWQSSTLSVGKTFDGALPNITGWIQLNKGDASFSGGCFSIASTPTVFYSANGTGDATQRFEFDASKSSSIFKTGTQGVVPSSSIVYFCIRY